MKSTGNNYLPERQDIVTIDFSPSSGHEIRSWHPAVVVSRVRYSELTGLVLVMPITHAKNNRLRELGMLIPLSLPEVDGFINPLQLFTMDVATCHVRKIGHLPDELYALVNDRLHQLIE